MRQANGEFLKDNQGGILLPRLESASLKGFISGTGGRYRHARIDDLDLRGLGLFDNPRTARNDGQTLQLDSWADQGYWLLIPLLVLAACAAGGAGCSACRCCWPCRSPARPRVQRPVLRPDQQGQRLLEQNRPASAARHFQDPQWRGMALYQAGDYAGAAEAFSQGDTAAAHYNRGNALARSGELEAALDAYEQALERQPDLQAALDNQALVQQLLQQREAKAEEQPASSDAQGTPGSETEGNSSSASSPAQGTPGNNEQASAEQPGEGSNNSQATPGNQAGSDDSVIQPPQRPVSTNLDAEQRQALEQWLREIPDNPAELQRRKFWYEQQLHQETPR